jgi:glycosyltransferase involved in cell wall biosynthesis
MKILIVGFHKDDAAMYPHLRAGIDILSQGYDVTYFHFRERGFYLGQVWGKYLNIRLYKLLFLSIIDAIRLYKMRNDYDIIIATDEFIYDITSLIFNQKIILWSFDIICEDNPLYVTGLYKWLREVSTKSLKKNKKIIIQDEDRLRISGYKGDVFLLPVSLSPVVHRNRNRELSSYSTPVIMQQGGIAVTRSSDKILSNYQQYSDKYQLMFHGIVIDDSIRDMIKKFNVKPIVSDTPVLKLYLTIHYCDIGFISYEQWDLNSSYNINACGQLVEFIRMGKPVIVMGNTDLREFVEKEKIGIGIHSMSELVTAIDIIKDKYNEYSGNCYRLFDKQYNIEKYTDNLSEWLVK